MYLRRSLADDAEIVSDLLEVGLACVVSSVEEKGSVQLTRPLAVLPMQETRNLTCSAGSCLDMMKMLLVCCWGGC